MKVACVGSGWGVCIPTTLSQLQNWRTNFHQTQYRHYAIGGHRLQFRSGAMQMQVKDFQNASGFKEVNSQDWTSWKESVTGEATQQGQQWDKNDRCMVF